VSVDDTAGGASADVDGIFEPEPLCMQMTVPVSSHAATNGSQYRPASCTDGSPRLPGSSEKQTARTPRAALRRTSAAASTGSHSGIRHNGTSRPPDPAHHSSTIQSL
jgi:hypothetical protein